MRVCAGTWLRALEEFRINVFETCSVERDNKHLRAPGCVGLSHAGPRERNISIPLIKFRHQDLNWRRENLSTFHREIEGGGNKSPFLLFLGSLLVAAAGIQVSLGLRPLKSVRDRITGIRSGQNRRLGGDFPEEILPLAREIDTLLDARERQIETARARAADLAHGLKTPIQVLIGGIAKLKSKGEGAIADDLDVATALMQRHVDRQLAKARVAANGINAAAPVAQICDQIAAVVRKTPEGERLHWSVAVPADLQASIHPDDLAEALGGLVENAARHARSRVALSAHRNADEIAIRISDDGPGIPEAELDEVMNRGRRLDTSEASSGLGLAIVADILEAWGGSVVFDRAAGEFSAILNLRATA